MLKVKSLWFMSLAAIVLAGCSSTPPVPNKEDTGREDDDDDDNGAAPISTAPDAPELVAAVSSFFQNKCSDCHGKGQSFGGLTDIMDVVALKSRNLILDNADSSPLFRLVNSKHQDGRINPRTKQPIQLPNDQEISFLRQWIDAGAPELRGNRSRIALDDYLSLLRLDASSVSRAEQNELVYVDFHAVYNNNRFSNAEMVAFANATLKILNELDAFSTSTNRAGVSVVYDEQNVPIAVRFNPARFNLDKQQDIVNTIVRLDNRQDINDPFACDVPAIPVLDFLHIAASDDVFNPIDDTFESAYSNIVISNLLEKVGIFQQGANQLVFEPISREEFIANGFANISNVSVFDVLTGIDPINFDRQVLDVLYNNGSDDERIVRGCLLNSNVSAANRCIDRLSQSNPSNGSTYISFDILSFGNVNQNQDFFEALFVGPAAPAGDELVRPQDGVQPFTIDGGEGIFQLPNSMLGFFVYNGAFNLVSNPPTYAVQNLGNLERGSAIAVSACSYCHASYTIPFEDAVLPTLLGSKNGREFTEAGFAFKLAQTQDDWNATFDVDAQYYQEVLRNVYVSKSENGDLADGIWTLGVQYLNDLSNDDIVAELGLLNVDILKDRVDNITDLSADLAQTFGGGLSRENFTVNYQVLVEQVAGSNEDFLRGCVAREASDVGDFGDNDDGTDDGSNDGEN
jgi:hypothetical protein